MTTEDGAASSRAGSPADVSRRLDRVEQRVDGLEREVASLSGTVGRVEQNQQHQSELNKLRFDSLDTSINGVAATLDRFMVRINGIVSGEIRLPQTEQGEALVKDYQDWRKDVDRDREAQAILAGQLRLLGRIAIVLATSQVFVIIGVVYSAVKP